MKKVFVMCLVLFVALAAAAIEKKGTTQAPPRNLIDLHANAEKASNKECLACHAGILKQVPLNRSFKMYHRVHLESKLETPKECKDCHQSVDLLNASAAALRKQVDPQLCVTCHSGGFEGAKTLYMQ